MLTTHLDIGEKLSIYNAGA